MNADGGGGADAAAATGAYHARDLGKIAQQHLELRGPRRPRLVRDLLCLPLGGDGLYVVGGESQVLRGSGVPWLMRELAPRLDGTRTVDELERALAPVDPADVRDALALLHLHGMIEDGAAADGGSGGGGDDETAAFFSRYLRRTGRRRTGHEAHQALRAARVRVVGERALAEGLAGALRALGMAEVADGNHAVLPAAAGDRPELVVVLGDREAQERAARACLEAGVPLLVADPETFTIGPLTIPRASACPTCVRLQLDSAGGGAGPAGAMAGALAGLAAPVRRLWQRALVSRVAQHVVSFTTGIFQVLPLEHLEVWRPADGETALHRFVARLPSCPLCAGARGTAVPPTMTFPSGHRESRARLFHGAAMVQPWHLEQPAGMQRHITPEVRRLQASLAAVPTRAGGAVPIRADGAAPAAERPAAAALGRSLARALAGPAPAEAALDAAQVGALLLWSFGRRLGRAPGDAATLNLHTASAGNLASAEAYLAAFAVPGLAPGLHRFWPATNQLLAAPGAPARGAFVVAARSGGAPARAGAALEAAGAVLVVVSALARVCGKYQARGYSYALLDAGVMAHRIELVARELGLDATVLWEFEDAAVSTLLGVDGIDHCPQLLVALGPAKGAR